MKFLSDNFKKLLMEKIIVLVKRSIDERNMITKFIVLK